MGKAPTVAEILGIAPDWTGDMSTDEFIAWQRSKNEHAQDPNRPSWCICGVAGLWETPGEWVCYRSAKRSRR